MCSYLKDKLEEALKKYGRTELFILNTHSINKNWDRNTFEDTVSIPQISYLKLRAHLMKYGRILEEHIEESYYILSMPVEKNSGVNALLIILFGNDNVYHIAAYAKELPFLSHFSQTAVNTIAKELSTLDS